MMTMMMIEVLRMEEEDYFEELLSIDEENVIDGKFEF